MEPIIQMPGYRVSEYQLVLNPHEELRQRITKIREEFATRYKTNLLGTGRPHVALVRFVTWDMMEEKLLQRLQTIAMGMVPFKVELKDYGSFPTHSIFIQVASRLPVKLLLTELREAQRLMKYNNENKPHFIDSPHIAIGSRLRPWQYEQGWQEYSHRHFTGRFIADSMLLLRRPAGTKTAFQIVRRLDFMNLPVTTRQGNLFI